MNLSPQPLGVPRTRGVRRRQKATATAAQRRMRRAGHEPVRGHATKRIKSWLFSGPPSVTITNPARDAKSARSGRLRQELQS